MANYLEKIREAFWKLPLGRTLKLDDSAWVFLEENRFGVYLNAPSGEPFSRSFAGAELDWSHKLDDKGHPIHLLTLSCRNLGFRDQFAVLCAEFADPGNNFELRRTLLDDPASWWERWKELLGNREGESRPYPVLAELLTLKHLLEDQGADWEWFGPDYSSHDLVGKAGVDYEVKSTLSRYDNVVTIAGHHQLKAQGRKLRVVFWRFESSGGDASVDSVVRDIAERFPGLAETIEEKLRGMGLSPGAEGRETEYGILEARVYDVDGSFPRVTEESFKGDRLPAHVKTFTYTVDLTGVEHENFHRE